MEKKKESMTTVKKRVKEKVMKEYQSFMANYRVLPKEELIEAMTEDAEKIAFYKRLYVIIVIIGDLYPEEWVRLDKYYLDRDILEEFYESYRMFQKDCSEEEMEKRGRGAKGNGIHRIPIEPYRPRLPFGRRKEGCMPNWIRNRIIVGKTKSLESLKQKHFRKDEYGNENLDLNTIIQRPKDLEIEVGSRSEDGTKIYLTIVDPKVGYIDSPYGKMSEKLLDKVSRKVDVERYLSFEEYQLLKQKYREHFAEVTELGKKACDNVIKYGYPNWYRWSIAKWGTKWNTSNTEVMEDKKGFEFDTAWEPPIPAIVELSKQHPGMKMAMLYSDEDIGNHVGYLLLTAGHIDMQGTFPDQSEDAFKLAFDLWGCRDSFRYDSRKKTFVPMSKGKTKDKGYQIMME